jgi:hypothetical protein
MALALYGFSTLVSMECRTCMQVTYTLCVIYECSYKFEHLIVLYCNRNIFNVFAEQCSIRGIIWIIIIIITVYLICTEHALCINCQLVFVFSILIEHF